jgi:hypothetical protein
MSKRILWSSMIALLILFETGTSVPALARGGVNGSGVAGRPMASPMQARRPSIVRVPRSVRSRVIEPRVARQFGAQNNFRFKNDFRFQNGFSRNRDARFLGGSPIGIWPFFPFFDTLPIQAPSVASETPSSPVVIVMSDMSDRAPERATPGTLPDYGYVAGCHAIPNGYHCDIPHTDGTR